MRDLFCDEELKLDRLGKLGRTDSLVRKPASISLKKEEKDKFSKKYGTLSSYLGDKLDEHSFLYWIVTV